MRLYKTTARMPDALSEANRTVWAGSQGEAAGQRKHFNSVLKIPRDNITTEEVDIPTDKKGLLAWLNDQTFA